MAITPIYIRHPFWRNCHSWQRFKAASFGNTLKINIHRQSLGKWWCISSVYAPDPPAALEIAVQTVQHHGGQTLHFSSYRQWASDVTYVTWFLHEKPFIPIRKAGITFCRK